MFGIEMGMGLAIGFILAGLVALYFGAEGLVRGASAIALRLGITPLVVGLTVVAFGTSAPELLVSLIGTDDIAVGNIVGSNVANLALILGAAAVINPLRVQTRAVKREIPIMLGATALFIILAIDGTLSRIDGAILLVAMAAYLVVTYLEARHNMAAAEDILGDELDDIDPDRQSTPLNIALIVGGIVGLALGAKFMVDGATFLAQAIGISDLVIGITIVAMGTSLPELATSVVASFRDEADISVGNCIGSNIFNLLLVMGVVASLGSIAVGADAIRIDLWVMAGVSLGIWPLLGSGRTLSRVEGALLIAVYLAYVISLFLR